MYEVSERVLTEQPTAVMRHRLDVAHIGAWIGPAFARVQQAICTAGLWPDGMPFARYLTVAGMAGTFDVEAGFPVATPLPEGAAIDVHPSRLPGGLAAVTLHVGPYDAMVPAYEALAKWIADRGGTPDGPPWEFYLSEPWGDPSTWRTEVIQPYRIG
jgi:effector-binding domain-containing protein